MQDRSGTTTRWQPWNYRQKDWAQTDISGFEIEALDGSIGKVDEATYEVGGSYLIVDTGPWIFGKKVMLPAGVVSRIDQENERVFVDRTKDQIKDAPELDEDRLAEQDYRDEFGAYYGEGGRGWSEPESRY
jgi:hypothetical protein